MQTIFARAGTLITATPESIEWGVKGTSAKAVFVEDCHRCAGTGYFRCYAHIFQGKCFLCHGAAKVRRNRRVFSIDGAARNVLRDTAKIKKDNAKARAARIARNAKIKAWFVADEGVAWDVIIRNSSNPFLANMKGYLKQWGGLSEKQTAAVHKIGADMAFRAVTREQSSHVGEKGDKIDFTATVIFTKEIDTRFGLSTLIKMQDGDKNVFTWFASGVRDDVPKFAVINVRGTIKDHNEFNGVKETQVTRCKITPGNEWSEQDDNMVAGVAI